MHTVHKLVGPPQAELVVPVKPQPKGFESGCWVWNRVIYPYGPSGKAWLKSELVKACPYQPGDTLEFWPKCDFRECENAAGYRFISPHLYRESECVHCGQHHGVEVVEENKIKPETRTVSRVTVRERDGWEWVVEVKDAT